MRILLVVFFITFIFNNNRVYADKEYKDGDLIRSDSYTLLFTIPVATGAYQDVWIKGKIYRRHAIKYPGEEWKFGDLYLSPNQNFKISSKKKNELQNSQLEIHYSNGILTIEYDLKELIYCNIVTYDGKVLYSGEFVSNKKIIVNNKKPIILNIVGNNINLTKKYLGVQK